MIIDSHIHVGQFYETYYSPASIIKFMFDVGVDYYVVSSTTTCEENYEKVLHEMEELVRNDEKRVLPVMWITPDSLNGNIAWLLESVIKWRCIKVHPFLHSKDWDPRGTQFEEVIDIANELRVPILIHTGVDVCCNAGKYETLISNHQEISFILAHGRPLNETIRLLKKYENVRADSAFMPVEDIVEIVNDGLSEKLLWGTDMFIPQRSFPRENMKQYYENKLKTFFESCSNVDVENVIWKNAYQLFGINKNNEKADSRKSR